MADPEDRLRALVAADPAMILSVTNVALRNAAPALLDVVAAGRALRELHDGPVKARTQAMKEWRWGNLRGALARLDEADRG